MFLEIKEQYEKLQMEYTVSEYISELIKLVNLKILPINYLKQNININILNKGDIAALADFHKVEVDDLKLIYELK